MNQYEKQRQDIRNFGQSLREAMRSEAMDYRHADVDVSTWEGEGGAILPEC